MKPSKIPSLAIDGDRITNLHETVVSYILSRLPTKDAVRTSILSKEWRNKWTSSYNVDIQYTYTSFDKNRMFVDFMNRILFSLEHQRRFRLVCQDFYDCRIQTWINTALRHSLESLEVEFHVEDIVLPCSLLNSNWLQKLKLVFCGSTLNVAVKNFAPKLISLEINGVDIVNENHNTSTTVKFSFPLLKTFTLRACKWLNMKSLEISAPLLTTFTSVPRYDDADYDYSYDDEDYDYSFVILAPRLAMFTCDCSLPEKFIMNGSSIISATLYTGGKPDNLELLTNIGLRVRKMVNEFTNLEELVLHGYLAEVSLLGPPLWRHDKLRQLTFLSPSNAQLLLELLHASPSLKLLRLDVYKWVDYDYGATESVPACVVSHLEEVEFRGFHCETPQYNLIKFLLMNGEKLKKLTMVSLPRAKQNEVKGYVSAFRIVDLVFTSREEYLTRLHFIALRWT